jgi:hypothetical protein
MHVNVKYAAQIKPGDWFAGTVNPHAPTRPCQPCAAAMRVRHVEVTPNPERPGNLYRFRFDLGPHCGLPSGHYRAADQVMTITV